MALLSFVEDLDDQEILFAVVADDTTAEYVWPKGATPDFDDERIARALDELGQEPPEDAYGWLELATQGLGHVHIRNPEEHESLQVAIEEAQAGLPDRKEDPFQTSSDRLDAAAVAFDDVAEANPTFGDDEEGGEDPQTMLNYVMMVLGPIDPDGPNGFLLRAAEGNPQPGDENMVIDWSDLGTDDTDDEDHPADDEEEVPEEGEQT